MKIVLPDNENDITLGKYMAFLKLDSESENYEDKIFSLFTGIDLKDIGGVQVKQKDEFLKHIYKALSTEGEFKQTFWLKGVEFGLIPNLDKMLGDPYTDCIGYSNKIDTSLDRLVAVLYRPIEQKESMFFANLFNRFRKVKKVIKPCYSVKKYEGTEGHIEFIQDLPLSIAKGALGFFLTLSDDLESHIHTYTEEGQVKGATL